VVLSLILAVGTLAGMLVFTWLSLVGLERVQVRRLERYEAAMLGTIFTVLGVLLVVFEHGP
jgi:NADH:ubiquinone oxidoreductase subunit 3 (subunit A)